MSTSTAISTREWRFTPKGASRYFDAVFLGLWLSFWAVLEVLVLAAYAVHALATGQPAFGSDTPLRPGPAMAVGTFIFVWLMVWTLFGYISLVQFLRIVWAEDRLGACRTLGSDSENRPRRDQFSTISPGNSRTIGQEMGEKWAGAAGLQPEIPKSDRLLVLDATRLTRLERLGPFSLTYRWPRADIRRVYFDANTRELMMQTGVSALSI